jgi:hypothetical protein
MERNNKNALRSHKESTADADIGVGLCLNIHYLAIERNVKKIDVSYLISEL